MSGSALGQWLAVIIYSHYIDCLKNHLKTESFRVTRNHDENVKNDHVAKMRTRTPRNPQAAERRNSRTSLATGGKDDCGLATGR